MSTVLTETIDGVAKQLRDNMELRLSQLSEEARSDLYELCKLLLAEEDENERFQIARTLSEIIFPESLKGLVDCDSIAEIANARKRLMAYRKLVGQEIKNRRVALGLTQVQLAELADLPQSHISRLEQGQHAPTFVTIERLATALQTTPSQLDPGFDDSSD
jgi:DNA-binding transcriptional regulator YiaG